MKTAFAENLAAVMMWMCAIIGHVGACGLLNDHWTGRIFRWAVLNSEEHV